MPSCASLSPNCNLVLCSQAISGLSPYPHMSRMPNATVISVEGSTRWRRVHICRVVDTRRRCNVFSRRTLVSSIPMSKSPFFAVGLFTHSCGSQRPETQGGLKLVCIRHHALSLCDFLETHVSSRYGASLRPRTW